MSKVRVYGVTHGHGSWARVTAGVVEGLSAHGLFAGLVPIDAFDEETGYDGYAAPVGLVVGPPVEGVALLRGCGWHEQKLVLIAPNSSWLPEPLLRHLGSSGVTGYVSPSAWGADVLRDNLGRVPGFGDYVDLRLPERVSVYPHGVAADFKPLWSDANELLATWSSGSFLALHLASTARERKGTRELLLAWQRSECAAGGGTLAIVIDATRDYLESRVPEMRSWSKVEQASVRVVGRLDATPTETAALYRAHHVVVQPSRGEGFGLVPLEAAACGAIVVATLGTGHTEYADCPISWVPMLAEAPIDDGPGALAPTVDLDGLTATLAICKHKGPRLASRAVDMGLAVGEAWSWANTTERWAKSLGLL